MSFVCHIMHPDKLTICRIDPPEMNTSQLLLVSTLGLCVNLFGMFAMGGHHHHVRRTFSSQYTTILPLSREGTLTHTAILILPRPRNSLCRSIRTDTATVLKVHMPRLTYLILPALLHAMKSTTATTTRQFIRILQPHIPLPLPLLCHPIPTLIRTRTRTLILIPLLTHMLIHHRHITRMTTPPPPREGSLQSGEKVTT